jgi:hypothetical protein
MCPLGFLMLGSTLQDLPSDSPAACRSACRRRQASPRTGSPNERSWRAPGLSWSATRSSWPLPNHLPRRRPSPNRNLRWPSTASRSWTQRATTPTPAIPAIGLSAHRRAPGPHSGRTQRTRQRTDTGRPHRTPTPDPGQRTPGRSDGTGHWTPIAGTGKRGHWTLAPDTGHWTLAEDADRVTTARSASGPPGPPCRATARWDAQPCSCGRRLGALLSSDDYGSSVKRTAKLHPL